MTPRPVYLSILVLPVLGVVVWLVTGPSEPPPATASVVPPRVAAPPPRQMTPRDPPGASDADAVPQPPGEQNPGVIPGFSDLPEAHRPAAMQALAS